MPRGPGNCKETSESGRSTQHQMLNSRVWDLGGPRAKGGKALGTPQQKAQAQEPTDGRHCSFKRWERLGDVSHHIGTDRMLSDAFRSSHHPLPPWAMC